ncbi:hypothetical protein IFO69_19065 [Echinicola sp. CAU 1574]|uniref:YD repeat-containing protein n=1 Tax=Echinicola arenosa TaxID=2774144 RepID=A0ABR9APZ6_9BACT|nr:hypothetical protein [Echinicola arenosa]MBD8490861.1 hypothetical protein [Echinicola arenosa]
MRNNGLLFVVITVFLGCETMQENEPLTGAKEIELLELLDKPVIEPSGELFKVITYGGNSDKIHSTRSILYPSTGDVTIHIIQDQNEDTVGIGLNYFENAEIQISHYFNFSNHQPIWQSTREYFYDSNGLLRELFVETTDQPRKLLARYVYDSFDKLERVEYPYENGTELQLYTYNDANRIASEWTSNMGQEDTKVDLLVYEYSEHHLIAKKSGERGSEEGNFQDAFRYYYDQSGNLSAQEVFDPYFGFQQVNRSEYYYY